MSEYFSLDDRDTVLSDAELQHYCVINENWRGKKDSIERRRIQNRLNQRAFRQRQRSGQSPKQYRPRSNSSSPSFLLEDDEETPSPTEEDSPVLTQRDRTWDELAQLINGNLMAAAVMNGRYLGIDTNALQVATPQVTSRYRTMDCPSTLKPVQLQHIIEHDLITDTIPHTRLRYNILHAIDQGRLDAAAFSHCIRHSGSLENVQGVWQRGGLLVWDSPDVLASWELSESFVRQWGFLLQDCEDLLQATNAWRSQRGENILMHCL